MVVDEGANSPDLRYRLNHCTLHAAAPKLLEALEAMLQVESKIFAAYFGDDVLDKAYTAIKDAKDE